MPTTLLADYYDVARACLEPVLTRVQFGTSDAADATAITNPIERPVTGVEMLPDGRTMRLRFLLEAGGAPAGTVIREIGLLTADGRLVARRVGPPLEVTADLGIGDFFELTV